MAPRCRHPAELGPRKLDGKLLLIAGGDSAIGRNVAIVLAC